MAVNMQIRGLESPQATEIYISAVPEQILPPQQQLEGLFGEIADLLRTRKANILQERVFVTAEAMKTLPAIRAKAYHKIDDGVAPAFLVCEEGGRGPIAGVQVHAVISEIKPEVIEFDGSRCGRVLRLPDRTYLSLSGVSAPDFDKAADQARAMLEKSESIIKQFGGDFLSVPRTWMWLGDILSWYDDFNDVRNKFFTERGTLSNGGFESMPASTGIGLAPAEGGKCSMDLTAILGPADSIFYLQAGGKQQSALDYGSAFSRATRATTPAGQTIYISGTASIDSLGTTTNIGDARGQIQTTIENTQAVLKDMDCSSDDVVQVVAYCKSIEVEKVFNEFKKKLNWPWITVICDICRDDLLFEIEAAAMLTA